MAKITREKFKTMDGVFDNFTKLTLQSFISRHIIDGLESIISIGKESSVFTAKAGDKRYAVKIYRLETCDFNRMYDYIKQDPRYIGLKHKRREIIFAWCQREFRNLLLARQAGVNCPTPVSFRNNVLIMQLIGDDEIAPKLKDLPPKDVETFFQATVEHLRKLYHAGLVHTDLSAFNILNNHEQPVLIDFSQCSPLDVQDAQMYLKRDIANLTIFFAKHGCRKDPEAVMKAITSSAGLRKL
ncbi:serine protein kinase RIO [Candidatus Woesearchaeota archaeon]|nr:serine protein kinase RIO [Candidatus Woesearchaeota archaeon]